MPEYQAPGVYVEEESAGSKSVEGVSTSTAGFLGQTVRGPIEPQLITSYNEFERIYGSSPPESDLDVAVNGFFKNGGSRCYVGRVTAADPNDVATRTLIDDEKNDIIELEANGPGDWGENVAVIVRDGQHPDQFDMVVRYWSCDRTEVMNPDDDRPEPSPAVEEVFDGLSADPVSNQFYEKQLTSSVLIDVEYLDDGRPKNGLVWLSRDDHEVRTDGGVVEADREDVVHIPDDLDELNDADLESIAERVDIDAEPSSDEFADELERIRDGDRDVDIEVVTEPPAQVDVEPEAELESETDDEVTLNDYEGVDKPGLRTGLAAFEAIDDISIVCVPDENDVQGLTDSIVAHCENMGDRFAILQSPQNPGPVSEMETPVDTSYAAYYYPWINVLDPVTNREKLAPPGGHIAGIYSRSDIDHGVHKAPANEPLRGIVGLQRDITKGEQDVLNPKGVNCIRSFQGRGTRVWGARTCSSDPEWKYINVRRLFLYIEQSLEEGTQWAVFEPNDEDLWARIRQSTEKFLKTVWREGGLQGSTADEAFFVRCGEETMTQDDIDNGRLIVEIGIAPVKPAEFVIFRISQDTSTA
ncbi:phage tail sheath family protein [Salinadaptatus halalkaliphilus]|uniref:Phage tail sheath family protein n=1 Tax=Salinadaptatus halalkaliphilus TaxID=2419781 RepID=A0A4S3TL84_9EURY|nr:phage tail sheath subtilisin-like domain-containing protein [Salinadaptatus halalkaliphilus]THE64826.1 phage tail sheath family protein [Salinadaptatus halalkaliphilus]